MSQLSGHLDQDLAALLQGAGRNDDWVVRRFRIGGPAGTPAALVYTESLVDTDLLQRDVLGRLMDRAAAGTGRAPDVAVLAEAHIPVAACELADRLDALRQGVARGEPALLIEGSRRALGLKLQHFADRSIESPPNEFGLRGPRDGFVENLQTNLGLLRRRLTGRSFQVEIHTVGRRTRTRVALAFAPDLAREPLVQAIRQRLNRLEYDGLLDSSQLAEMLTGSALNPFPLLHATERPDRVAAALLDGKVALLVDGTPGVLTAPATFPEFLWAADDYYSSPLITLLTRFARVVGLLAVVYLPAVYVGVELYNPGLVRTPLALFLASERTGLPLNALTEVVILELMMEMIHESTVRLPSRVGSAATIVGGLIVGTAAVQARILSSLVVIITAAAAIGTFTFPSQDMSRAWRAVKWLVILAAGMFGVYGIFVATVCLVLFINSLDVFGLPYLAPLAPPLWRDLARDFALRLPWSAANRRPDTFSPPDPTRGPGIRRRQRR